MALLLQLVDVRDFALQGNARIKILATRRDGSQKQIDDQHTWPPLYPLAAEATWQSAEITIEQADYQPVRLGLRWENPAVVSWSDPCTQISSQDGNTVLTIPLGRMRFAPGEIPPFGGPNGNEKGIYLDQRQGGSQKYMGERFNLQPVPAVRLLKDLTPGGSSPPTCLIKANEDDGWKRTNWGDHANVDLTKTGGFAWLEYGSPATHPQQPRFLVALWAPLPAEAIKDNKIDMLVFFSPSTENRLYPPSSYPFRDKYPYVALAKKTIDEETGETHDAKVQPYVILGYKYLFRPTHLAAMCAAAQKPAVMVMPIFPNAVSASKQGGKHQWQPFNSRAGLYRLLIETRLFLQREGYSGAMFDFKRFNGQVAPTSGEAPPPPPAFSTSNRTQLDIRSIIVSGYSGASVAMEALLRTGPISASAADFPHDLFGAAADDFNKRWLEFWALDFFLDEKKTGIPRARYEAELLEWLQRDPRRLRLVHSGWTMGGVQPDAFYPRLRKQLVTAPALLKDAKIPARWATDWRDPAGRWSAVFFSSAFLRTLFTDTVVPQMPVGSPDGAKGDPASAVHGFSAQLGFGHALNLWKRP